MEVAVPERPAGNPQRNLLGKLNATDAADGESSSGKRPACALPDVHSEARASPRLSRPTSRSLVQPTVQPQPPGANPQRPPSQGLGGLKPAPPRTPKGRPFTGSRLLPDIHKFSALAPEDEDACDLATPHRRSPAPHTPAEAEAEARRKGWLEGLPSLESPQDVNFLRKHNMAVTPRVEKSPYGDPLKSLAGFQLAAAPPPRTPMSPAHPPPGASSPATQSLNWPPSHLGRDWRSDLIRRNIPSRQKTAAEIVNLCKSELHAGEVQLVDRVVRSQTSRRALTSKPAMEISPSYYAKASENKFQGHIEEGLANARQLRSDIGRMKRWLRAADTGQRTLSVRNKVTGTRYIAAIAATLAANPGLTSVDLSNNRLTDRLISEHLVKAFDTCKQLSSVDLSYNRLRDMEWVSELLLRPSSALTSHRSLRSPGPARQLQKLVLRGNMLGDHGTRQLAYALSMNVALPSLDISSCSISDTGAQTIGSAMNENDQLTHLDISWNKFATKGAFALADGVRANRTLRQLNLASNGLGDEGGMHVAEVLLHNEALLELDLSQNRIGPKTCQVLAQALPANECLERLLLQDNAVGREGARALVRCLEGPSTTPLLALSLQGCSFQVQEGRDAADYAVITYKETDPDGHYALRLEEPSHYSVAVSLAKLWHRQKQGCWRNCRLNDRFFTMHEGLEWPERLPTSGVLCLDFKSSARVPPGMQALPERTLKMLWHDLDHVQLEDEWRLDMVRVLVADAYFTAEQVGDMMAAFTWAYGMKLDAAVMLFPRIVDPQNITELTSRLSEGEGEKLFEMLGIIAKFQWTNPTGHYDLDLSRQVDYAIAWRLRDLAEAEFIEGTGYAFAIRNVHFNGLPFPVSKPIDFNPPGEGYLSCDFASTLKVDHTTGNEIGPEVFETLCKVLLKRGPIDRRKALREISELARKQHLTRNAAKRLTTFQIDTGKRKRAHAKSVPPRVGPGKAAGAKAPMLSPMKVAMASLMGSLEGPDAQEQFRKACKDPSWRAWTEDHYSERLRAKGQGAGSFECLTRRRAVGLMPDFGELGAAHLLRSAAHQEEEQIRLGRKKGEARDWEAELEERMVFLGRVAAGHTLHASGVEALAFLLRFWPGAEKRLPDLLVMWWARCLDRSFYSEIVPRSLPPKDHAVLARRLGWNNVVNFRRPDWRFELRLHVREEYNVAKQICQIAVFSSGEKNLHNLEMNGAAKAVTEDDNMWPLLTGHQTFAELHAGAGEGGARVLAFDFVASRYVYTLTAILQIQTFFRRWKAQQNLRRQQRAVNFIKRRFLVYRVRKAGLDHIDEEKLWQANWVEAHAFVAEKERVAREKEESEERERLKEEKEQKRLERLAAIKGVSVADLEQYRVRRLDADGKPLWV